MGKYANIGIIGIQEHTRAPEGGTRLLFWKLKKFTCRYNRRKKSHPARVHEEDYKLAVRG